jgi:hypothetical protein
MKYLIAIALVGCSGCFNSRGGAGTSILVPGDVWIRDVTVVSSERSTPLVHAHVFVRGGRIVSVGVESPGSAADGVTIVDGTGRFLTPGLIDGHVHLGEVPGMSPAHVAARPEVAAAYFKQLPRSYLYFGFTAVVDLNIIDRARVEEIRNAEPGPAVFDCGTCSRTPTVTSSCGSWKRSACRPARSCRRQRWKQRVSSKSRRITASSRLAESQTCCCCDTIR